MKVLSARTWLLVALGSVATAAMWLLVNTGLLTEDAALVVSDVGSATLITAAALVVLSTALSFGRGEPMRRYWLPIGVGVLLTGLGDWVWTYFEVVRGVEPYPSLADALYVAQYPFTAFGLVSAALAYRALVDVRRPLALSAVLAAAAGLGVTLGLLLPYIVSDPEETVLVKLLSSFYPLADIALAAAPAVFIVLVLSRLGGGMLAWPWRAVAAGTLLLAISDTAFSWQDWTGAYAAGGLVDLGWILAFLTVAVGASIARDIATPAKVGKRRERERAAA